MSARWPDSTVRARSIKTAFATLGSSTNMDGLRTSQALETNRDKFTLQAVSGKGCTVQSGQMQRRVSLGGGMKALVSCLSVLLLVSGNTPQVQAPRTADSCHFTVSGELAKPTISGPEDITALVHVVEQPDSPVEILGVDFKDSWLSVAHERVI